MTTRDSRPIRACALDGDDFPEVPVEVVSVLNLALPDHEGSPSKFAQLSIGGAIACHVSCKLCLPEVDSCRRVRCEPTVFMPMPEASVYEDCSLVARDHKIRRAGKPAVVDEKPEPSTVEIAPDEQFCLCVSPANAPHHPRTLLRSDDVSQLEAPARAS